MHGSSVLCLPPSFQFEFGPFEVECNSYCRDVIEARMSDGYIARAPIYEDMAVYAPTGEESACNGIIGGFPCQAPTSLFDGLVQKPSQGVSRAGAQKGLQDPRTSMVEHIFRVLDQTTACAASASVRI